jgi:predicted RNase H-like nuclease (RuvC/YqgF family)
MSKTEKEIVSMLYKKFPNQGKLFDVGEEALFICGYHQAEKESQAEIVNEANKTIAWKNSEIKTLKAEIEALRKEVEKLKELSHEMATHAREKDVQNEKIKESLASLIARHSKMIEELKGMEKTMWSDSDDDEQKYAHPYVSVSDLTRIIKEYE